MSFDGVCGVQFLPSLTPRTVNCYGANHMQRSARRYLLLLVALIALGFFLYKFRNSIAIEGFHWSIVGASLRRARIGLLVLALLTIYFCFAVRSLRWIAFSRTIYERVTGALSGTFEGFTHFPSVYHATLMGFSCTFLLGRAGEPIRPVLIGKKEGLPIASMFGVYVLERLSDMASTVVLAGIALLLFQQHGTPSGENRIVSEARSAGVALFVLLILAVLFLIYFRYQGATWLERRLRNPKWRTGWREKVAVLLEGFSDGLQAIRTWGDVGVILGYTALHWICVALVYLWVAHAFGGALAQLTLAGALLVLAFTMVGSAVQLPGVGGGAQLATFLVLTLILGVEKEPAAVFSIVVWLIGFAGCCVVGLPLLFREGWSMGELRRMAQAEERAGEAALLQEAEHGGKPERRAG
jgi:glycosyltransferase 2 family protein